MVFIWLRLHMKQGIRRECKALPLTVRQMVVQQVQLEAIKRREAVRSPGHRVTSPRLFL